MLVTGHYEFRVIIGEKSVFRRFSDFEWLHDQLLQNYPGCKIPSLPEKNVRTNLYVNNTKILEERMKLFQKYLQYIEKHIHLSKSKEFGSFLSEDFKPETKKQNSILGTVSSYVFINRGGKTGGLHIFKENDIEQQRKKLVRLKKAASDLQINLMEKKRLESIIGETIKNLFNASNKILDKENFAEEIDINDDEESSIKIHKFKFHEEYYKNKQVSSHKISQEISELSLYIDDLQLLVDVFDRKEIEDDILANYESEPRTVLVAEKIERQKERIEELNNMLKEEIEFFKRTEENIFSFISKFIEIEYESKQNIFTS